MWARARQTLPATVQCHCSLLYVRGCRGAVRLSHWNIQSRYMLCEAVTKADQPRMWDYPPKPPDYRHTEKFIGLAITILCSNFGGNCHLVFSASWAPNIDRYVPHIWPWPWKQLWPWPRPFSWPLRKVNGNRYRWQNTIHHWPWSLTYDLDLQWASSQVQGRPLHQNFFKIVGQTIQPWECRRTDGQTDATRTLYPSFVLLHSQKKLPQA